MRPFLKRITQVLALLPAFSCATSQSNPQPETFPMGNNKALLVLDLQNDFCHPEGKLHGLVKEQIEAKKLVRANERLIEAAQRRGVLTVVSPIQFDYSKPLAGEPEGIAAPIVANQAFDKDAFGGQLVAPIERFVGQKHVALMPKPGLSAFANTPLKSILADHGVGEVVISGLLTNYCVESTARDAFDMGLRVRIVGDATATFDASQHDHTAGVIAPMLGKEIRVADFESGH